MQNLRLDCSLAQSEKSHYHKSEHVVKKLRVIKDGKFYDVKTEAYRKFLHSDRTRFNHSNKAVKLILPHRVISSLLGPYQVCIIELIKNFSCKKLRQTIEAKPK